MLSNDNTGLSLRTSAKRVRYACLGCIFWMCALSALAMPVIDFGVIGAVVPVVEQAFFDVFKQRLQARCSLGARQATFRPVATHRTPLPVASNTYHYRVAFGMPPALSALVQEQKYPIASVRSRWLLFDPKRSWQRAWVQAQYRPGDRLVAMGPYFSKDHFLAPIYIDQQEFLRMRLKLSALPAIADFETGQVLMTVLSKKAALDGP